jgi:hypothetical protein
MLINIAVQLTNQQNLPNLTSNNQSPQSYHNRIDGNMAVNCEFGRVLFRGYYD